MLSLERKTIAWDTKLFKGLMEVANINEKSLKEVIKILCLMLVYEDKKTEKTKWINHKH